MCDVHTVVREALLASSMQTVGKNLGKHCIFIYCKRIRSAQLPTSTLLWFESIDHFRHSSLPDTLCSFSLELPFVIRKPSILPQSRPILEASMPRRIDIETTLIDAKESAEDKLNNVLDQTLTWIPCCSDYYNTDGYESGDDEAHDATASRLSYVGQAAYQVLRKKHAHQHHQAWNVTTGAIVGELDYTPKLAWNATRDLPEGHTDWFPAKLASMIQRTQVWCDVLSLGPPDGIFMTQFQQALLCLAHRTRSTGSRIVVRMMFGNIVGMPVNCTVVIRELTKHLPTIHNLHSWVGAWRKGTSWNHAKIIAVDGKYLHTGGHNLWDYHVRYSMFSRAMKDLLFVLTILITHHECMKNYSI